MNTFHLTSDAILELLDELRADLQPRMRRPRLRSGVSYEVI